MSQINGNATISVQGLLQVDIKEGINASYCKPFVMGNPPVDDAESISVPWRHPNIISDR